MPLGHLGGIGAGNETREREREEQSVLEFDHGNVTASVLLFVL
jgi:hypothetical protein